MPELLNVFPYDLLMLECSENTEDVFALVRGIRKNEIGMNPFVSIVLTTWVASVTGVQKALASGADDVVIKPFSANLIISRINLLIGRRKPFVFTEEYTGPVRRETQDRLAVMAPVEVPNSLRAKSNNEKTSLMSQVLVDSVIALQRCKQLEVKIQEAVVGLGNFFKRPYNSDFPVGLASNLLVAAGELGEQARQGEFFHIVELCRATTSIATDIRAAGAAATTKDLALLGQTAAAISAGLRDRDAAVKEAHEIARTVAKIE